MMFKAFQAVVPKIVKWILKKTEQKIEENVEREDRQLKNILQNNMTILLGSFIWTIQDHGCSNAIQQYEKIKQDDEPANSQTVQKPKLYKQMGSLKSLSLQKISWKSQKCISIHEIHKPTTDKHVHKPTQKHINFNQEKTNQNRLETLRMSISYKNTKKNLSASNIWLFQQKNEVENSSKTIKTTSDQEIDFIRKRKRVCEFLSLAGHTYRHLKRSKTRKLTVKQRSAANNQSNNAQQNQNQSQTFEHLNVKVQGKANDQIIINSMKQEKQNYNLINLSQLKTIKTLTNYSQSTSYLGHDKLVAKNLENHPLSIPKDKLQPGVNIKLQFEQVGTPLKKNAHSLNTNSKKRPSFILQNKPVKINRNEQSSKFRQKKSKINININSENKLSLNLKNSYNGNQSKDNGFRNCIKIQDHILYQELICATNKQIQNENQFADQHEKKNRKPLKLKKSVGVEDQIANQNIKNDEKSFKTKKRVEIDQQNSFMPSIQIARNKNKHMVCKCIYSNFQTTKKQKERTVISEKDLQSNNRHILSKPKVLLKL